MTGQVYKLLEHVRHRLDDLEINSFFSFNNKIVRHRLDDLEIKHHLKKPLKSVRHRLDDLEMK